MPFKLLWPLTSRALQSLLPVAAASHSRPSGSAEGQASVPEVDQGMMSGGGTACLESGVFFGEPCQLSCLSLRLLPHTLILSLGVLDSLPRLVSQGALVRQTQRPPSSQCSGERHEGARKVKQCSLQEGQGGSGVDNGGAFFSFRLKVSMSWASASLDGCSCSLRQRRAFCTPGEVRELLRLLELTSQRRRRRCTSLCLER